MVDYIGNKYVVDSKTVKTEDGAWNTLDVTVSKLIGDVKEKVGSYSRNYSTLYNTFFPFVFKGKELALYSREYMYTRVMDLSDCKDLGGEDDDNTPYDRHFCPVDYHVPFYRKVTFPGEIKGKKIEIWIKGDECFDPEYDDGHNILGPINYCDFGFVAGCAWGDDTSRKIKFLDLAEADKGIIKRDERLGYLELPRDMNLKDAIDMEIWQPNHP